jgi:hypothetical protein
VRRVARFLKSSARSRSRVFDGNFRCDRRVRGFSSRGGFVQRGEAWLEASQAKPLPRFVWGIVLDSDIIGRAGNAIRLRSSGIFLVLWRPRATCKPRNKSAGTLFEDVAVQHSCFVRQDRRGNQVDAGLPKISRGIRRIRGRVARCEYSRRNAGTSARNLEGSGRDGFAGESRIG